VTRFFLFRVLPLRKAFIFFQKYIPFTELNMSVCPAFFPEALPFRLISTPSSPFLLPVFFFNCESFKKDWRSFSDLVFPPLSLFNVSKTFWPRVWIARRSWYHLRRTLKSGKDFFFSSPLLVVGCHLPLEGSWSVPPTFLEKRTDQGFSRASFLPMFL